MSDTATEPNGFVAEATVHIAAPPERVWHALTDPVEIKRYMLASDVTTDWQPGSEITWAGEYQGTPYRDHGMVLEADAPTHLALTHFSPLAGKPDIPANYHVITYDLEPVNDGCRLTLTQDNNETQAASDHSQRNWTLMLESLKSMLESE